MELQKTITVEEAEPDSFLAEAIRSLKIKLYRHVNSDKNYNPKIDNLYKIKLKSQIVIPVTADRYLLGVIRLSKTIKSTKIYSNRVIDNVKEIYPILIELFSCIADKENESRGPFKCHTTFPSTDQCIKGDIESIRKLLEIMRQKSSDSKVLELIELSRSNIEQLSEVYRIQRITLSQTDTLAHSNKERLNILIVDDTKLNTSILKALLHDTKFDINIAHDGDVALETLAKMHKKQNSADIVFLDHHMPNMLGSEVAEYIFKKPQKFTATKLYIVSITNDPEAILDKKHLYDFHIRKPFMKLEIMNVIEKIKSNIGFVCS